uniref:Uncharacterized protein n=1 Tax=Anguilla anguilla TaxID=7936 RepID=A0A0E9S7X0_ANGAN
MIQSVLAGSCCKIVMGKLNVTEMFMCKGDL